MSFIKDACSSRTHPRLHYGVLFLERIPHQYISVHNHPTSLPPLIKLHLTSKIFKNFINTQRLLLWACTNRSRPLSTWTFIHGLGLKSNSLLDHAKFSIWVQTIMIQCNIKYYIYILKFIKSMIYNKYLSLKKAKINIIIK